MKQKRDDTESDDPAQGPAGSDDSAGGVGGADASEAHVDQLPAEPVFTETQLNERVAEATAEARERHLRVLAEYENYRKRVQREREMWAADAIERFVADLVQVLDNFERALSSSIDDAATVLEGVRITEKQLRAVLAANGVEVVDPAAGTKFDPRFHEAIQRLPAAGHEPGTVVLVLEKGYTVKGRLVRPARVQVAG